MTAPAREVSLRPDMFRVTAPRRDSAEWLCPEDFRIVQGETIVAVVDCANLVGTQTITDITAPDYSNAPQGVTASNLGADRETVRVQVVAAGGQTPATVGTGWISLQVSTSLAGPMMVGFPVEVLPASNQ